MVLEPAWVRESIVVTATGTPLPQAQTSAATTVLGPLDLALRDDLISSLRIMPGTFVVQTGQLGAQLRCLCAAATPTPTRSCSTALTPAIWAINSILARFRPQPSTAPRSIADPTPTFTAREPTAGVVSLTTPHGTTSFPSLLFQRRSRQLLYTRARSSNLQALTRNSTISAPSVGCKRPTICRMMSIM